MTFANGNSFGSGPGQAMGNGSSMTLDGEVRNTEPFWLKYLRQIQPGAV